jgi:MinD-like ATPase involved in chromosome partitioning or flagellar assembly
MGIRVDQIEQAMIPVVAQIPLDPQVVLAAVNHGVPFVVREPGRPVSQALQQLAERVRDMVEEQVEGEEQEAAAVGPGRPRGGRVFG